VAADFMCFACHGPGLENSGSMTRDLRESTLALKPDGLEAIVRDGALATAGMPSFGELSPDQVQDILVHPQACA
jgi:quinohemoprotein ethanol dehydrogenase